MKQTVISCSCGSSLCQTRLTIKEDNEKPANIILSFKDRELSLEHFVSLSKESFAELVKAGQKKFGKVV